MADIVINGITYPAPKRVAFPGSDGKPVVFDLPTETEAALNGFSTRPPQTKAVYEAVQEIHRHLTSPYNFKGALASSSALPAASAANANDTYYLIQEQYRVTSNGESWEQSSMDESNYLDELSSLGDAVNRTMATAFGESFFAFPGYDVSRITNNKCINSTGTESTRTGACITRILSGVSPFAADAIYLDSGDYLIKVDGYSDPGHYTSESFIGTSGYVPGRRVIRREPAWKSILVTVARTASGSALELTEEELQEIAARLIRLVRTEAAEYPSVRPGTLLEDTSLALTADNMVSGYGINASGDSAAGNGFCLTQAMKTRNIPGVEAVAVKLDGFAFRAHGYTGHNAIYTSETYAGCSNWVVDGILTRRETWDNWRIEVSRYPFSNEPITELDEIAASIKLYRPSVGETVAAYAKTQMAYSGLLPLLWKPGGYEVSGSPVSSSSWNKCVHTDLIPVIPGENINYEKNEANHFLVVLEYDGSLNLLSGKTLRAANRSFSVGGQTAFIRLTYRINLQAGAEDQLTPEFAADHFIAYRAAKDKRDEIPLGLHTAPANEGVLNCIKRARQMTDIKWTPAVNIDRVNAVSGQRYTDTRNFYLNIFKGGRQYEGLPYSQKNLIGGGRGIDQFVTGAAQPRCKECVESGYDGDQQVASHSGTVCVVLTSYALNGPVITSTYYHKMAGLTKLYDLSDDGAYHSIEDIALCDILLRSSHSAIVTDIIRDMSGHVTHVEVSEATLSGSFVKDHDGGDYGGKCRRKMWQKDEFLKWFASFALYRYDEDLLAAIPYYPNPYVPMEDEGFEVKQPLLPCIPYEGDKMYYLNSVEAQRSVRIIIAEEGYSHLRVKKNGENFTLLGISGLTEVTVECTNGEEALYEAYLCNMANGAETNTSAACSWLQLTPAKNATMHENEDGSYTFSVQKDADFGIPLYVLYNGEWTSNGAYSLITSYQKEHLQNGRWKYTFTVTPPEIAGTVSSIRVDFDLIHYGRSSGTVLTPTSV